MTDPLEQALVGSLDLDEVGRAARAFASAFFAELRLVRPELADRLEPPLIGLLD